MDDRLKETLSAMMDDEADELSVRRLLSREGQDEIRVQFQRWQQMGDLIQHRHPALDSIDVSDGVRNVLEGHQNRAAAIRPPGKKWQWSAVAMVTLALVVGFGAGTGWNSSSVETAQPASAGIPELAIPGMDKQQRQRLSRYLFKHAQHNSVGVGNASVGYARAVSASGAGY